jgi:serine/threonine protein kinase
MLQPPDTVNASSYVPPVDPIAPLRSALRGHYDIEREIGQGAFATVFLARDLKHERKVALKVLNADPTSDIGELRFIREIRTLARLQHPNILPLHDSGHVEALLYYVMPYVSGDTLRDRIDREKQLPIEEACSIARDVADALAYAHGQGIIHRDIKPENILLSTGHPILADFGIARAIDLAGVRTVTRTGTASPGTPAYMSPEQLMGDKDLDGRSDTYSLGCVLFEMLTGKPPFGGKEGFVKRFTEPPPKASTFRKDLPKWVDEALEGALQRAPQDRYATAKEFIVALCQPERSNTQVPASESIRRQSVTDERLKPQFQTSDTLNRKRRLDPPSGEAALSSDDSTHYWWRSLPTAVRAHPKTATTLLIGVVAAGIAFVLTGRPSRVFASFGTPVPVDTARFVILSASTSTADSTSAGSRTMQRLYEAFDAWNGLRLVSDADVDEAVRNDGRRPASLSEAFSLARRLGSGRMVLTRAVPGGVSHRIRAELYDVSKGASTGRFAILDSASTPQDFARAAVSLVAIPNRRPLAEDGDGLTRSYHAWTEYNLGHVALGEWDLLAAARHFSAAASADPTFPTPYLWLAQIQAWTTPEHRVDWGAHAAKAARDGRLTARDRIMAQALLALADRRYPAACEGYRALTQSNPGDFVGWYGLGECQAFDSTVVASSRSPSGWKFRSSYRATASAYDAALRIEPRAHSIFPFRRLQKLLPTSATTVRVGRSEPPYSQILVAYPSLEGIKDTLGFIPYPLSGFALLPASALRTHNAALQANTELLSEFTLSWTRQLPADAAAFVALAEVLESSGEISGEPFEETVVMKALRQTRALTRDPEQLFETTVREVWLRFKREEFEQARRLTDSLLGAYPHPTTSNAEALFPLAALTGKLNKAVELGRLTQPFLPASAEFLPAQVRDAASELYINSAFGICGERIADLEKRVEDAVVRYLPAERAGRVRADLMARPYSMTVHCTAGQSALKMGTPLDRLHQIQQAYARREIKLARALLDSASEVARRRRPGDKSLDYTFHEAWVRVAIGDTAVAIGLLDNALGALPGFSSENLQELGAAAAAGHAMVLRARLAAARGDMKLARRWATNVALLWKTSDQPIRALANEMQSLARSGGNL